MTVAVGRLHFSVTIATPSQPAGKVSSIERSYRRTNLHRAADADRARWADHLLARAGRPF